MTDEISIDRLILDIPGLDAAQARDLAHHISEALAASLSPSGSLNFGALTVDLPHSAGNHNIPRLADSIVNALLTQIGGQ